MSNFFQLITTRKGGDLIHQAFGLGVLVASLRALVHLPAGAGRKTDGAKHAGRILDEAVIAGEAKVARLNVREPIQGVEQQPPGALVQRDGHRVGGEVAAAQVVKNRRPVVDGLAGLGVLLTAGARNFDANAARKPEEERARGLVIAPELAASFLQRFLQLEGVSLNRKVKIADRKAAGEIANRPPGQKDGHARVAGGISNLAKGVLLGGGKTIFKKVDVIGHVL